MATGRRGGGGDNDDWFVDVEPPREPGVLDSDPPSAEDDWLLQPEPTRRARSELPWLRIAIVAGGAIVLLIAGLGAAGVFSGKSAPRQLAITSVSLSTPTTTAGKRTAAAPALPTGTLKPSDSGAQVSALQRALKALGYSVGTVDGQYGPSTKTAVASFQHDAGLTADGVFGPKTLNALIQRAGP
jgi:hypothetical protein